MNERGDVVDEVVDVGGEKGEEGSEVKVMFSRGHDDEGVLKGGCVFLEEPYFVKVFAGDRPG